MSPFQETKKRENANEIINIFPLMEVYIKASNTYIVRYNKMVPSPFQYRTQTRLEMSIIFLILG